MSGEAMRKRVLSCLDESRVISLAQSALRIPSLSGEERQVAEFFAREMAAVGLDSNLQAVPESKNMSTASWNAIGRLRGKGGGNSLMFNGHLDHNPVCAGWTKDPFGGEVENGWLYGFVHMKAANAAYLAAVEAVVKAGVELSGDVILANVCGELRGGAGTKHALAQGLTADYFIVGEPTELELCFTHTASLLFIVHVFGRMKHYSTVESAGQRGVNAIEQMARLVTRLGRGHSLQPPCSKGGWLDYSKNAAFPDMPQTNVGSVRGGIGATFDNTRTALFPDRAALMLDVRPVPGMTLESIKRDLEALIADMKREDESFSAEVEVPVQGFTKTFQADPHSAVAAAVRAAHTRVLGTEPKLNRSFVTAASDASWLADAGIPGLVYGPTGRFLSRPDERAWTADIVNAARVYADVILTVCGAPKQI